LISKHMFSTAKTHRSPLGTFSVQIKFKLITLVWERAKHKLIPFEASNWSRSSMHYWWGICFTSSRSSI